MVCASKYLYLLGGRQSIEGAIRRERKGDILLGFDQEPHRSCGLGLLGAGLVLGSYWLLWGSIDGFVNAIDHGEQLFGDFQRFYYPMGEVLFAERWPVRGYYYTSFFALGLSLVALLPLAAATVLWGGLQVGWVAVFYYVSGRYLLGLSARGMLVYLLLLLSSFSLLHNFKWGQVSVLVTLGVVAAFALHQQGRSALGGIALALVTCIKYYPGTFVVYFLIRRDGRFLAAFGIGLLGFYCLLPAALLGPGDWWYFERASAQSLPEAARLLRDFNTQYFVHVLNRWGQPLGYRLGESTLDVLRLAGVLVFCANCVVVWWLHKREIAHREALSAAALFLALPFVVADFVASLFRLLALLPSGVVGGTRRRSGALAVAGAGYVFGGAGEWVLLCLVSKLAVVQWGGCVVGGRCGSVVCALCLGPTARIPPVTRLLLLLVVCAACKPAPPAISWSVPGGRGCGSPILPTPTAQRAITFSLRLWGLAGLFLDYDQDGWLDIYLVDGFDLSHLRGQYSPINLSYRDETHYWVEKDYRPGLSFKGPSG